MHNFSRLKIWVCEFVSGGGLAALPLPRSWLEEGVLMRDALINDLHALGMDCITSHDVRVSAPQTARSIPISGDGADIFSVWQQQITQHQVDACWVIAPESDGLLQRMHALVEACGVPWIGCDAQAIQLTTDKRAMADLCAAHGLAVLPHQMLAQLDLNDLEVADTSTTQAQTSPSAWVVKPWDGAGCEHTYYFKNKIEVIEFKQKIIKEKPQLLNRLMLQPFCEGQPLSFSAIATHSGVQVIAAHAQTLEIVGDRIQFVGAKVNAAAAHLPQMQALAALIKTAIPGLLGYWGADVILTPSGQPVLVEINPRLTTPYIALSGLLADNPAGMVLAAMLQQQLPSASAQGQVSMLLPQAQYAASQNVDAATQQTQSSGLPHGLHQNVIIKATEVRQSASAMVTKG